MPTKKMMSKEQKKTIDRNDIVEAFELWRLWVFWGWLDVRQRYRRSLLGPLWVTMTMGVSVLATGIIYAYLFNQDIKDYLPYVALGFVLWSLIAGYISEACTVFIQNEGFIGQLKLPYLLYPLRLLWRYLAIFLHHALVLSLVLTIFVDVNLNSMFSSLLGLLVTFINIFWIGLLLGLISVRLRDLPVLISTLIQLLFMITPVIWPAKALGERSYIAELNPIYHILESVRAPLLDAAVPILNMHLQISTAMAVIGTSISLLVYSAWRQRLLYWL